MTVNRNRISTKRILKMEPLKDIRELLNRSCELFGEKVVFGEKISEYEKRQWTRNEMRRDVNALGTALTELGFRGKHIAILAENSYNWVVSFFAISCGVGVAVPLDKEMTDDDILKLLRKSDASAVITSKTFKKLFETRMSECPLLEMCVLTDDISTLENFHNLDDLIEQGNDLIKAGVKHYFEAEIDREALAVLIFTSGTTGANKGVMLSHKNLCKNVENSIDKVPIEPVSFSVLPMNHSFELGCNILIGVYCGATIVINDNLRRLVQNMRFFQPNMALVVPLFLETLYRQIWSEATKNGLDLKLKKALNISNNCLKFGLDLRGILFKSLKNLFGGKFSLMVCGGAPINIDVLTGLSDLGFFICNGYGISECSPVISVNTDVRKKPNSVGKVFPAIEVKIDEPDDEGIGEILVKGDTVMLGYYKDPESTTASFRDGWFKTGDFGRLDDDNYLYLAGRKKSLIILDNGKNVYPEEIENVLLEQMPYVREVIVYETKNLIQGRELKQIAVSVYINKEENPELADKNAEKVLLDDIRYVNKKLPSYKQVHYLVMSETEFDKTTTKKIIRQNAINSVELKEKIKI